MSFEFSNLYFGNLTTIGRITMWFGVLLGWLSLSLTHIWVHGRSKQNVIAQDDEEKAAMVASKGSPTPSIRYQYIDTTRGLAISFVVYFHFMWNMRHNEFLPRAPFDFFAYSTKMYQVVEFWIFFIVCFILLSEVFYASFFAGYFGFAYVTAVCINWHYWASQTSGVGMIMYCVGLSSYIQNRNGMKWVKIWNRIRLLITVAASISIVTYIIFGRIFVYFGAIHCISLVSILHIPFVMYPQSAIWGALFVFLHAAIIGEFFLEVPIRPTVDYMPWFENLGYLLIGIASGHFGIFRATQYTRCIWGFGKPGVRLEDSAFPFLGQHSLLIFVAHQILIFPIAKAVAWLVK